MLLEKDIELIEGLPAIYIVSLNAIAISDLHLGFEGGMAKAGVAIPKANLKNIIEIITKAIAGRQISRIIIVGDIKNDFSRVNGEELNEMREIMRFLAGKRIDVDVVKGNHDNFIEGYARGLGITVHMEKLEVGGYLFAHGDKPISGTLPKTVVIGHEHPSIGIRTKTGVMERFRCFLYGETRQLRKRSMLLVLPAIGYFETGSDVNVSSKSRIMSPILKKANVDEMRAIAVGDGSTLDFGKVKELRNIEL